MTYYEILGVSRNASQKEIRTAYKKLIKQYHPDLYQGDKIFAEKKTQEINEAYDILSDNTKKYNYDLSITTNYNTSTSQAYDYTPPKYSSGYSSPYSYNNYKNSYYSKYNNNNSTNSYSNKKDTREVIYDEFAKKLGANIVVILFIFVLYLIIFIATLLQFKNYKANHKTESTKSHVTTNTTINKNNYSEDDFNINDYFSDSDLLKIYNEKYTDVFDSFQDFKEAYSIYWQLYYGI